MDGIPRQDPLEIRDLSHAPADLEPTLLDHADPSRVVAAILEPPEAINQDRHGVLRDVGEGRRGSRQHSASQGRISGLAGIVGQPIVRARGKLAHHR